MKISMLETVKKTVHIWNQMMRYKIQSSGNNNACIVYHNYCSLIAFHYNKIGAYLSDIYSIYIFNISIIHICIYLQSQINIYKSSDYLKSNIEDKTQQKS